jgi:hypothetical protein
MAGLDWRKQEKEGYTKLESHLFVKNDDLEYITEKDLIRRFAIKENVSEESIADLYRVFMEYLNMRLRQQTDDEKGYYVPNLGRFMKKNLYVEDLLKSPETVRYRRAKKQLDLYMKTEMHYKLC